MTILHLKQYKKRNKSRFNYDDVVAVEYHGPPQIERGRAYVESVTVTFEDGSTLLLEAEPFDNALARAGLL